MGAIGLAPGIGQELLFRFLSFAGQLVFAGRDLNGLPLVYRPGFSTVAVYRNGHLLVPGEEYTANDGSQIFPVGWTPGDNEDIVVVTKAPFSPAGTYTQDQANAYFGRVAPGRLQFTNTGLLTYGPVESNRLLINGRLYTIPNSGITVAPAGAVNALKAIYATPDGASARLILSDTQPSLGVFGTGILGTDENFVHVGDAVIQTGTLFSEAMVLSRHHRREKEYVNGGVSGVVSATPPVLIHANSNMAVLAGYGERVEYGFRGLGYNYGGAGGNFVEVNPFMQVNGGAAFGSPYAARGPSAIGGYGATILAWNAAKSDTVTTISGYTNIASSAAGTGAAATGVTYVKVRQ